MRSSLLQFLLARGDQRFNSERSHAAASAHVLFSASVTQNPPPTSGASAGFATGRLRPGVKAMRPEIGRARHAVGLGMEHERPPKVHLKHLEWPPLSMGGVGGSLFQQSQS